MYIYDSNSRKYQHVSEFLTGVHNDICLKYFAKQIEDSKEAQQAEELQLFFQQLKDQARGVKAVNNIISEYAADYILEQVQKKTNWQNPIFQQSGGWNLEKQLTEIIESVYDMMNVNQLTQNIYTGTEHGTIFLEKNVLNTVVEDTLKDLTGKTTKFLKNKCQQNNNKYPWMMASVQRKTDIQGGKAQININWEETGGLERIFALLNQATFSAKNYNKNDIYKIEKTTGLKLGRSNPYRAVYATLSFLGYNEKTINSAFFAAFNSISHSLPNNKSVSTHIYHLRFIYELTGIGMNLLKQIQTGERAKFIIYNEPDTDFIYVLSTSQIIIDMLENFNEETSRNFSGLSAFTEGIYLTRSIFK